jgi:hypothetical protein
VKWQFVISLRLDVVLPVGGGLHSYHKGSEGLIWWRWTPGLVLLIGCPTLQPLLCFSLDSRWGGHCHALCCSFGNRVFPVQSSYKGVWGSGGTAVVATASVLAASWTLGWITVMWPWNLCSGLPPDFPPALQRYWKDTAPFPPAPSGWNTCRGFCVQHPALTNIAYVKQGHCLPDYRYFISTQNKMQRD